MQVQWNSNKDFLYEERHESQNQQLQSISKKTKIEDIWILGYMEQDFFFKLEENNVTNKLHLC